MTSLADKISRRISSMATSFQKDCAFSLKLAVYRMCDDVSWRFGIKNFSEAFHRKKDRWIMAYLEKQLQEVTDSYRNDGACGEYQGNAPIWVCWWSGAENAPDLVKQCIRSIYRHSGNHPVYLIDQNSYRKFIEIPDYMLQKVQAGRMGLAHLSDYIRVSLLGAYGGLWLDATIFCADTVEEICFEQPFFTCKSEPRPCRYVSEMRWTTFVLGGWRGNPVCRYLKNAFEQYWQQEDTAIDYLLFDYLIELGYEQIPAVKQLLDDVPVNNLRRDDLQAAMNRAASPDEWDNIVQPDTVLYKLSWRERYSLTTSDGQASIYAYFLRNRP